MVGARSLRGRYRWTDALGWLAAFLLLAAAPLLLALSAPGAQRGPAIEFGAALGLLGLGLVLAQAWSSGRLSWVAASLGTDNLLHFHRHLGLLAGLILLAHPAALVIADPDWLRFLDPRDDLLRALSLWALLAAILLLLGSSLWRQALGLSYEHWRLAHGALALLILGLGLGHALMVRHHLDADWQRASLLLLALPALYLPLHTRLLRPWLNRRRPWRVVAVESEPGDVHSLELAPEGHAGLDFQPGQFAWFTLGETPFALQQHPFSLAGSADRARIRFSASAVGDFTRGLGQVRPGSRAWIEGPFGAFVPASDPARSLLMIAGGIGVTPFISMLRSLADQRSPQPVTLIYANRCWSEVAFRDELEQLAAVLDLALIHVLEEPPADWSGESGRIDRALLDRHLPDPGAPAQYLICGPAPLMDAAESSLRDRGVGWRCIFAERFEVV